LLQIEQAKLLETTESRAEQAAAQAAKLDDRDQAHAATRTRSARPKRRSGGSRPAAARMRRIEN
jgi:hypothetical protein